MRRLKHLILAAALLPGAAAACHDEPALDDDARSAVDAAARRAAPSPDAARMPADRIERTELWVALTGADAVAVLDAATGGELSRIPVGRRPTYVKVSPDGRWAAVANSGSNTATVIDARRRSVVRTLETGPAPKGINWSPDSRRLWIVNEGDEPGSVWVYSVPDFERVGQVAVGRTPHNVVLSPDGRRAFVTNTGSGSVSVVDAAGLAVLDSIPVDGAAHNLTLSPDGDLLYVTLTDRDRVAVVSTRAARVERTIAVVRGHHVPAVDGSGHLAAGGFGEGAVSIVRLANGDDPPASRSVPLDAGVHGVAFLPGGRLLATSLAGDYVAEIDPRTSRVLRRIPVPGGPFTLSVRVIRRDGAALGPRAGAAS